MPRHRKKSNTTDNVKALVDQAVTKDAFQNMLARTGWGTPNLMEGTNYPLTRLTRDYYLMNSLYRNNWLAAKVCNIIPKDMLKNWIKFTSGITPEQIDQLNKACRRTRIKASLLEGLTWGRLYGGAAGLMVIEGQENLEEPLDLEAIGPGDFKGLMIVDRWSGVYPDIELVEDINSPEYGLPKYYEFRNLTTLLNYRVHHSRIVRFIGHYLPEWEKQAETYWGASIIEPLFEELKKRDNTSANIAMLVFQARLTVLKIKDMDVLLTGTNKKAQQDFYSAMQAQNWLLSNQGRQIIGAEDDFQSVQYSFGGLNDIYESFMLDMSGASGIPCMKLFGRSPQGMNATGEYDLLNYYETVEIEQESHLRPALEKLLPVLCMSELGDVPTDFDFDFNPIGTPTEKELADIVKNKTDVILDAYERAGIPQKVVFQELQQLADSTGLFTNLTDEIVNKADGEIVAPPDLSAENAEPEFSDDTAP
jgi:phage-related protein (TIGR01555 family)